MSDNKPKKDLRARLGRTITPNTPGAPAITPPAGPAGGPATESADASTPAIAAPAIAAPAIAAPAIAAPAIVPPIAGGAKLPFGGPDIAPPPFAQPKAAEEPAAKPKPKPPADPFAAGAAAAGPREVRLVIDEKPVDDSETGRQSRGRTLIVASICLVLGAVIGGGFVSVHERNITYNLSVRDGRAIYNTVNDASARVLEAQQLIDRIAQAAARTDGTRAVDYASITTLRAMENPMPAQNFSRRSYWRFAGTVDDLFHYHNNVQRIWESVERLANTALPEARRAELDRTASGVDERANATFGAVLSLAPEDAGGGVIGQLAFLEAGTEEGHVLARGTRTGAGREFALWTPENEISATPEFVIAIDGAGSTGVLAVQTGAFGEFVRQIQELDQLMDETVETQGRLTTALGEIASLPEAFQLGGPEDGEAAAAAGDP
jgi:hypothetical protein